MNRRMNETVRIGWRGSRGNRAGSIRGGISRPIGVRALGEITELVRPVVMTEFEDMRDYFTSAYFQGCQERLRTMPDILVGAGADFFSAQGQQRLSFGRALEYWVCRRGTTPEHFPGHSKYNPTISSNLASKSGSGLKVLG